MGAAEDEGVDLVLAHRVEVLVRHADELAASGHPLLDELDEARARAAHDVEVRRRGEGVEVGPGLVGAQGRDDTDPAVARRGGRAAHGRADHLDDRHVVALAGVVEHGGARGVARDDEDLHAVVDETVEALEGQLAGLRDGPRAVGRAGGVTEVRDRLVGQLVEDRPHDGEPAIPGVEDPDR